VVGVDVVVVVADVVVVVAVAIAVVVVIVAVVVVVVGVVAVVVGVVILDVCVGIGVGFTAAVCCRYMYAPIAPTSTASTTMTARYAFSFRAKALHLRSQSYRSAPYILS